MRGVSDRWSERKPLLKAMLASLDADVLCFQEVLTGEFGQDRRALAPGYHVFPCKAALFNLARSGGVLGWYAHAVDCLLGVPPLRRLMVSLPAAVEAWRERLVLRGATFRAVRDLALAPFFGNSVACRIAEAHEIRHSTLVLGDWRAAQRIEFLIGRLPDEGAAEAAVPGGNPLTQQQQQQQQPGDAVGGALSGAASEGQRSVVTGGGGFKVWVVNTHLDHEHADNRQRQALAVCDWMDREKGDCAAVILCGDFNGPPHEALHRALRRRGYASAHAARHGREPRGTWPTGIRAPLADEGEFECLDFVYVWAAPGHAVRCAADVSAKCTLVHSVLSQSSDPSLPAALARRPCPGATPCAHVAPLRSVLGAGVFGLQPADHDCTLFPSDHAAVKATIQIRRQPVDLQEGRRRAQTKRQGRKSLVATA